MCGGVCGREGGWMTDNNNDTWVPLHVTLRSRREKEDESEDSDVREKVRMGCSEE